MAWDPRTNQWVQEQQSPPSTAQTVVAIVIIILVLLLNFLGWLSSGDDEFAGRWEPAGGAAQTAHPLAIEPPMLGLYARTPYFMKKERIGRVFAVMFLTPSGETVSLFSRKGRSLTRKTDGGVDSPSDIALAANGMLEVVYRDRIDRYVRVK